LRENLLVGDFDLPIRPEDELPFQRGALLGQFVDRGEDVWRKSLAAFGGCPGAGRAQHLEQILANGSRPRLPVSQPSLVVGDCRRRSDRNSFDRDDAGKEGFESIEVVLLDRIEFVIVTLRATNRKAEENRPDVAGQIVERVLPSERDNRGIAFIGPHPQVTGGDLGVNVLGKQLVAGNLFLHEAIEGNIRVERPHDKVAIFPSQRPQRVGFIPGGFGESHEVEPGPSPGFAVMRARQQAVHQPLISIGSRIVDEGFGVRWSRRQAEQVERHAADQFAPIRLSGKPQTARLESGEHKRIDGRSHAVATSQARHRRPLYGLK
jgi:hypothetical protein